MLLFSNNWRNLHLTYLPVLSDFHIQYWNRYQCYQTDTSLWFSGLVTGIVTQESVPASLNDTSARLEWKCQHDEAGKSLSKQLLFPGEAEAWFLVQRKVTIPWGKGTWMASSAADFGFSLSHFLFVPQESKAKYCTILKGNDLNEIFQAGLPRKWSLCPFGSPLFCQSVSFITF